MHLEEVAQKIVLHLHRFLTFFVESCGYYRLCSVPALLNKGRRENILSIRYRKCALDASFQIKIECSVYKNTTFYKYSTGTDGHRVRCHQFYTSSLLLPENCIKSSNTFSPKMKKLREALLLLYNIGGQDQELRHMVYPPQSGRRCSVVSLRTRSLCEKLQMNMADRMKLSGASFALFARRG